MIGKKVKEATSAKLSELFSRVNENPPGPPARPHHN
jgi:hypothetical protein